VKRNGAYLNPLTVHRKLPPGEPIPASMRAAFDAERARLVEQMSTTLLARAPAAKPDAVRPAADAVASERD
jgi:hypothetical protein